MIRVTKASGMGLVVGQTRFGFQRYGVPEGGAMNFLSMARMNAALGQSMDAAGFELTGHFKFEALEPFSMMCGPASAKVKINEESVHVGQLISLNSQDLIEIMPPAQGLWTQVAFLGGLDVESVLGSRGLCTAGGFGGGTQRLLKVDDEFGIDSPLTIGKVPSIALPALSQTDDPVRLRALKGPEYDMLEHSVNLLPTKWELSTNSSRMGYRFESSLELSHLLNLPSSYACTAGLVQMPPDGQIVVLMADAQVSGGYPRYASILQSELWKVSLLLPGQSIEFDWVSFSDACQYNKKSQDQWCRFEQAIAAFRG